MQTLAPNPPHARSDAVHTCTAATEYGCDSQHEQCKTTRVCPSCGRVNLCPHTQADTCPGCDRTRRAVSVASNVCVRIVRMPWMRQHSASPVRREQACLPQLRVCTSVRVHAGPRMPLDATALVEPSPSRATPARASMPGWAAGACLYCAARAQTGAHGAPHVSCETRVEYSYGRGPQTGGALSWRMHAGGLQGRMAGCNDERCVSVS